MIPISRFAMRPPNEDTALLMKEDSESYLARLLSVPVQVLPVSLFAFGGPQAHLGIAHERFVEKLQWLDDERFLEVIALGSALPGPTSTQVITSMGFFRAGPLGGLVSFIAWALPGFLAMTVAGLGAQEYLKGGVPVWMAGLAPAAVSLVVIAAVKLWNKVCGDNQLKMAIAALSAFIVLATQGLGTWIFPLLMLVGGLTTVIATFSGYNEPLVTSKQRRGTNPLPERELGIPTWVGIILLIVWIATFAILSYFNSLHELGDSYLGLFYAFYRMGSIIFGGGQVMLPMLMNDIVNAGWVSKDQFFIGFALIQSLPGPLFNISAYLGAVALGVPGAFLAAAGLFGPGVGLFIAVLPLWERVRKNRGLQVFMAGVNSAAIGLVVAAIALLWQHAVHNNASASVCLATGVLVGLFGVPAPFGIVIGGVLGYILSPAVLNIAQTSFCV
ncbi:Chromate Ion Transporter (CHR) Family [Thraustotheca clavata]|uniref:Chromate Ion Transporter (CHR) Family n=1 Tax=Thraustotheca clavata TaxID=74557 RepID=A0A1V9ZXF4_9STRA|nr:Chromate Ion Transporter (CHR) Family [Thraustotheca clavata]